MILLDSPQDLTLALYRRIVAGKEPVGVAEAARARVEKARAQFLAHLEGGALCYGVNTGLGALVSLDLNEDDRRALSRQILLGRAGGLGPPFPAAVVRGAILIKLVQFLTGHSAVSAGLCDYLAARLNDDLTPYVPSEGLGMAGEIIPLSHLVQPFIGEGFLLGEDGRPHPAATILSAHGLAPYKPQSKEGIALINGVAFGPAAAFERAERLGETLTLATLGAATTVEGLGASLEAFDEAVARLRPDPGIADINSTLRQLFTGSQIPRGERQPSVSIRVTPQVLGAFHHALAWLYRGIVAEWRAVSDNPAFLPDGTGATTGRLLHSGNFHSAELTHRVEAASLALAQVAILSERRLHRLLDQRHSGLSPQLAKAPGRDAGLVILHKAALGVTAKIRALAVPPSLLHGESSFGTEDAMTLIFPALDRLGELDRLTRLVCAYELYAALVAVDQRGARPGAAIARLREAVRETIPPYDGDRPYGHEVEALARLFEDKRLPLPGLADLWEET